jgi:hypothetical protein
VNICITTCSLLFMACIQAFLGLLINKKFEWRIFVVFVNKFWQYVMQNHRRK